MRRQRYRLNDEERWMTRRALARDAEIARAAEYSATDRMRETMRFLDGFNPEFAAALRMETAGGGLRTPQYWLAELDCYDNPKLIDGSHDSPASVNQAAYLIQAMRLGEPNRRFAVARVELSECVPSADGVNHEAVKAVNTMRRAVKR